MLAMSVMNHVITVFALDLMRWGRSLGQLSLVWWDAVVQCGPLKIIGRALDWEGDIVCVLVVFVDHCGNDSVGVRHPLDL